MPERLSCFGTRQWGQQAHLHGRLLIKKIAVV